MRRLPALLVALLASGCTLPGLDPAAPSTPPPAPAPSSPASTPPVFIDPPPPPVPKSDLLVQLAVADRWVKPTERVDANATAPEGATVSWFLAPRNPIVPGEDRVDLVPPALGLVSPGSASAVARMDASGRYAYAARDAPLVRFNVTVVPSVPRGGALEVRFVVDEWGARFAPSDVTVGEGVDVFVRNRAPRDVDVVRADQMARVAPDGPSASFAPPRLLGDYDLVAFATDGLTGEGAAVARLIVDPRKPDANVTLGPWTGTFATLPPTEAVQSFPFESRFVLARLALAFEAASEAAGPARVRVRLEDANGTALASGEGAAGAWELRDLPAGAYRVVVEPLEGVRVSYRATGAATRVLEPPASFFST